MAQLGGYGAMMQREPLLSTRRAEHDMDMLSQRRRWTVAQVRALQDESRAWPRYELIDGELIVTPAPTIDHYRAVMSLVSRASLLSRAATSWRGHAVPSRPHAPSRDDLPTGHLSFRRVMRPIVPSTGRRSSTCCSRSRCFRPARRDMIAAASALITRGPASRSTGSWISRAGWSSDGVQAMNGPR